MPKIERYGHGLLWNGVRLRLGRLEVNLMCNLQGWFVGLAVNRGLYLQVGPLILCGGVRG